MKLKLFLFLVVFYTQTYAQPPKSFYTRFGGNGYDVGYDVKQTFDNGYIIVGSTSSFGQGNTDLYLVKLDSLGQKVFQKSFGNYNNEVGKSITQLTDSGFVIAGYTNSNGFGGYDFYIVKTDKLGNTIWEKTFGGSDWDFAHSIEATTDGGFIVAGTTYSFGKGNADGYVLKINTNGIEEWSKTFGGQYDDEFKSIIQTADGGYALTGYTKSYLDVDSGDVWVYKLNNVGDSVWCKFFGGTKEDFGSQIIEHPNTNIYVSGASQSYGNNLFLNGTVIRLSNTGSLIFQRFDNTSNNFQIFNSITVSKKVGLNISSLAKLNFTVYGIQSKILETDIDLNYTSGTDFGSFEEDETFKIIATKDKGYACIGYTKGYNAILTDCYFVKLDSNLVGGNNSIVSIKNNDNEDYKLNIFPNPSKDIINLHSSKKLKLSDIKLVDAIGNYILLDNKIRNISDYEIQISNLIPGIYFIEIGYIVKKIIVAQ